MTTFRHLGVLTTVLAITACAQAEVKTVAYYRFGESDENAAAGQAIEQSTDENHGAALMKPQVPYGQKGPVYEATTGSPAQAAVGSKLAAKFDGKVGLRRTGLVIPGNDNFGIEAFAKAEDADKLQYIVSWGDGTRGFSLLRSQKGGYQALLGGSTVVGWSGEQPLGTWVHLAIVRTEGQTTFYFNGQPMGSTPARVTNPTVMDGFAIGACGDGKEGLFRGSVDEVRVFTFKKGEFSPKDLLCNQGTFSLSLR